MSNDNQSMPLVSVVVRTKDRPQLLLNALKSIFQQTYRPIEVVLVNDGGSLLNREVLRDSLKDISLNYIHLNKNAGRAEAANIGITNCMGQYIGFLDDDDEFYPEHIDVLVTSLENSDYDVAYTNTEIVYKILDKTSGELTEKSRCLFSSQEFSYEDLLVGNYIPFNSLLFKKNLLDSVGLLDKDFELYEDWDLLIRCAQKKPFLHIKKVTAMYNQWDEASQIAQKPDKKETKEYYYKIIQKHSFSSLHRLCDRYIVVTKDLAEKDRALQAVHNALTEKDRVLQSFHKALAEKDKVLQDVHKALAEKDKVLQEVHKALAEKDKVLQDVHKAMTEKDRVLQETKKALLDVQNTITVIQDSLGWQLLNSIASQRDRLFPTGTNRRRHLNRFVKAIKIVKNEGITTLIKVVLKRKQDSFISTNVVHDKYKDWIKTKEAGLFINQRPLKCPVFAIVFMVSEKSNENLNTKTLQSILGQTYDDWTLYLPLAYKQKTTMNKVRFVENRGSYIPSLNEFLSSSSADFLIFITGGDILSPHALNELSHAVNSNPSAEIFYSDEDYIDDMGRYAPFFKPDWNPDMMRAFNYIGPFFAIKKGLFNRICGLNDKYNSSVLYDLLLRASENTSGIIHIPKILYHRSDGKKKDKEELDIQSNEAEKIKRSIMCSPSPPIKSGDKFKFSLVVLTKDNPQFIIPLLDSLRSKNSLNLYETIVGDTGSTDREVLSYYASVKDDIKIIRDLRYHFSLNYNHLISVFAEGEFVGIINNDIVLHDMDFLSSVEHCFDDKQCGALGYKLLYPDGNLQHAGVFFFEDPPVRGLPYHRYHRRPEAFLNHIGPITRVPAVTGAFMFCRRRDFISVGGFDRAYKEEAQDIDLCLKLRGIGKEVYFAKGFNIIHIENGTRAKDSENSQDREYFLWKWSSFLEAHILNKEINRLQ